MKNSLKMVSVVIDTPTNDFTGNIASFQSDGNGKTLVLFCIIGAIALLATYLFFICRTKK